MPDPRVLELLAAHDALGAAPAAEHAWLAAHGTLRRHAVGDVLSPKGELVQFLFVLFSGNIAIRLDRGAGSRKLTDVRAGGVTGALPFSRGARAPNDVVTEEASELLALGVEHLPELIRECPYVTAKLVHAMLDRARQFNSYDLQDEKLISLGKLAAGLAHELNNPAAAAARSAKRLAESQAAADAAARAVGAAHLSDAQLAAVDVVRALCAPTPAPRHSGPQRPRQSASYRVSHSAIARADREDALGEWLAAHGANEMCAGPLSETTVTLEDLDALAAAVDPALLDAVLRWISAGCQVRALAAELEIATARITDLVGTVKGFTYMDHAPIPEPVDVGRGIADTLTLLAAKARAKDAELTVDIPEGLPLVHAEGAELNQVWMNLIENAIDAIPSGGQVLIAAAEEQGRVVVRVTDDGAGIPAEVRGRIFDPFFTTKGVGKGTGLGLDIVRRIVQRHEGAVEVESRPGRTEFTVRLPLGP